jgi:hypothetical protein
VLLDSVNLNHYYQQHVAETLWVKPPSDFGEYKDGIHHVWVFASIGLKFGLALCGREDLLGRIEKYSEGYGIALQLVDDLREVEEDRIFGYNSFPIVEGAPYKESFKQLFVHIEKCKESAAPDLGGLLDFANRLEVFAHSLDE